MAETVVLYDGKINRKISEKMKKERVMDIDPSHTSPKIKRKFERIENWRVKISPTIKDIPARTKTAIMNFLYKYDMEKSLTSLI